MGARDFFGAPLRDGAARELGIVFDATSGVDRGTTNPNERDAREYAAAAISHA